MSIDGAILARLKAITAVTDIVGTGTAARIHTGRLPQDPTLPAIVMQLISAPRVHAFGQDPGLVTSRWQLDAWGATMTAARDLGDAIRGDGAGSALSRWGATLDGTVVQDAQLENESGSYKDVSGQYRNRQDYMIWYEE